MVVTATSNPWVTPHIVTATPNPLATPNIVTGTPLPNLPPTFTLYIIVVTPTPYFVTATPLPWYVGGTLHNATIAEWRMADSRNKIATVSDWN